mgnify:CR=1 FL=1
MKKIIVTGGAGFIGSNLINKLIDNDSSIIMNIDKLNYASNRKFIKKYDNYFFSKIDLKNHDLVHEVIKDFNPDHIYHLAAESHVDRSIASPREFIDSNIIGTFNLLESIRKNNLENKVTFQHISTDEVYGDLEISDKSFTENSKFFPNSPYSASKASSDHLVRAWNKTFGIKTFISNCSNNFGPNQDKEKFIPKIIFNLQHGKEIPVYGSGNQIRDWLYVEDHVDALIQISEKGEVGNTYNIGGNQECSNIEIINLIQDIFSKKIKKSISAKIKYVKDRAAHDFRYSINSDKAKKVLGWEPKFNLISGLETTVDWYLNEFK